MIAFVSQRGILIDMVWEISPVDLVIFIGVFQGLLLSIVWFIKGRHRSQLALAFFLFFLSLKLLLQSDFSINFLRQYPLFVPLFDCLPFLFPPLMFFFIDFSINREKHVTTSLWIHFLPAVINIQFHIALMLYGGMEYFRSAFVHSISGDPPVYQSIFFNLKILSAIVYMCFSIRVFIRARKKIRLWKQDRNKRRWLFWLVASYMTTWIGIILLYGLPILFIEKTDNYLFLRSLSQTILFTWMVYLITVLAISYPRIFEIKKAREKIKAKINLSDNQVKKIWKDLSDMMTQDEAFRNPDISLINLADRLQIHPNTLSFVVNEKSRMNFANYINSYRVEKFIELAEIMDTSVDTYLTLALQSGFRSKSTFNRIFRELKQVTPSQFMENLKK